MGVNLARNKIGLSKDAQPKAETVSLELDLINCLTKTIRRCDEVNLTIKARSNSEQGCLRFWLTIVISFYVQQIIFWQIFFWLNIFFLAKFIMAKKNCKMFLRNIFGKHLFLSTFFLMKLFLAKHFFLVTVGICFRWSPEHNFKIGNSWDIADILLIWTNVAWTNVHLTMVLDCPEWMCNTLLKRFYD